jgi:hypothetical protein
MMSIFVPKTFGFSADRIKGLVERDLGKVRQVDIVKDTCFIHLEKWYEGGSKEHVYPTFVAIDRMEKGEAHKITSFNHATNSYTTLFLLKNHSKKQCQEVHIKEKDVLEQIEEGCMEVLAGEGCGGGGGEGGGGELKPMRLVHPDSLSLPKQQARWRPPSPPGPPPPLPRSQDVRSQDVRKNRTEGRSSTDDQYIHKLEKEIASLRAQNYAQVKDLNDLRVQIYTQQVAADTAASSLKGPASSLKGSALKTRSGNSYNPAATDEREEQVAQPIAGSEYNAKAIPKARKRAAAAPKAPVEKASSSNFRLETF